MFVPRQQYPRELKIATMTRAGLWEKRRGGGARVPSKSETAGDLAR